MPYSYLYGFTKLAAAENSKDLALAGNISKLVNENTKYLQMVDKTVLVYSKIE